MPTPSQVYTPEMWAAKEAIAEKKRQRKEFVNNAISQARKDLAGQRKQADYDVLVADRVKELIEGGPEDLRQKAFGDNQVIATRLAGGGVQLRSHRTRDDEPVQKPHLEPQQTFARTEGDQQVLPDQTKEQFNEMGWTSEDIARNAPAPHTPDNMLTKYPHQDGYSDLDKYGYTENLDLKSEQPKKTRTKKHKEEENLDQDTSSNDEE
jgi:hypothetical protein